MTDYDVHLRDFAYRIECAVNDIKQLRQLGEELAADDVLDWTDAAVLFSRISEYARSGGHDIGWITRLYLRRCPSAHEMQPTNKDIGDRIGHILADGGIENGEQEEGTTTFIVAPLKNGEARPGSAETGSST